MALLRSSAAVFTLFFCSFAFSSAVDMSIISYDRAHGTESSWRTDDEVMAIYEEWLVKHGKNYNALGERDRRFQVFKDNLRFIDEHNSWNHSFRVGLNRFADLTNEEYRSMYLGARNGVRKNRLPKSTDRYSPRVGDSLPDSVDWRKEGAVVEVKDQGSCGEFFPFIYFILLCFFSVLIHLFNLVYINLTAK